MPLPFVRNIILGTYSMGSDNETDGDEDEAGDGTEFEFEGGENWGDGARILELILLLLLLFFEVSILVI